MLAILNEPEPLQYAFVTVFPPFGIILRAMGLINILLATCHSPSPALYGPNGGDAVKGAYLPVEIFSKGH